MTHPRELWVSFEAPISDVPPHVIVLSFLPPGIEARLQQRYGEQIVSGRAVVQDTRTLAREAYVQLIARIGSTPCCRGQTLRQLLRGPGNYSRWWLLDLTEKDCLSDEDTIYLTLLHLSAIEAVKRQFDIDTVRFRGAPAVLMTAASGEGHGGLSAVADGIRAIARGVAGRMRMVTGLLPIWWRLRKLGPSPVHARDVLLHGYWDWTVQPDAQGRVRDRYFTDLPDELRARGRSVGWLASVEPHAMPWQQNRRTADVIAASAAHDDVTLLERFVTPADIFRTAVNLRYALAATTASASRAFRASCRVGAFDLHPLVRRLLLRDAWGATLCRLQLVALAASRAVALLRPAIVLSPFELFVRARAIYTGVRAAAPSAAIWGVQHAGYSSDKTLGVVHPRIELRGTPDGCAMPAPDGMFAMGSLSARIWESSGFAPEQVAVVGGLRYQDVRIEVSSSRHPAVGRDSVTVLLAGGVGEAPHLDLCEAAVFAASDLAGVRLLWRDHPHYQFSRRSVFARFRGAIIVTTGTLDEDLRHADLVLFSQSGVGEEAVMRGIPAWQWLWPGFNTSPFLDVPVVPAFTSATALRREIEAFVANPSVYRPTAEVQRRLRDECFGPNPPRAAATIAESLQQMLRQAAHAHA